MSTVSATCALGLTPEELETRFARIGLKRYRSSQAFHALHREYAADWGDVRQLPAPARLRLRDELPLRWPQIADRYRSEDGTVRYLIGLSDGEQVEAVYLPDEVFAGEGTPIRRRTTFCISTQVGCPVNCQFCLTATLGLRRNLDAGEIAAQALMLLREHKRDARRGRAGAGADRLHIVYMGMGEPFLNYDAVVQSIRVLTHPAGAGISPRRITVSTSGIVEKIARFGAEFASARRPRLAISLNASHDDQRARLMPLHRGQGQMEALMAAARAYPLGARERLTFEYVLLAGVNDTPADAERVVALVAGIRAKVNLIAWNSGPELGFRTPAPGQVADFQRRLIAAGVPAWIRRPRGRDIYAACGQLKRAGATRALGSG